jgi:hypothetical protein
VKLDPDTYKEIHSVLAKTGCDIFIHANLLVSFKKKQRLFILQNKLEVDQIQAPWKDQEAQIIIK